MDSNRIAATIQLVAQGERISKLEKDVEDIKMGQNRLGEAISSMNLVLKDISSSYGNFLETGFN